MEYDEDGDPQFAPPNVLNLPDIRGDCLVIASKIRRLEGGARSVRGFIVPSIEVILQTTEGEFKFFLSRDEAMAWANGIIDVTCDA